MTDFETVDFFTDESLVPEPYPYFDYLRSKCPVATATPFGILAVTGYEEALEVYKNPAFSSCVSLAGPFSGLPFGPGADDVSEHLPFTCLELHHLKLLDRRVVDRTGIDLDARKQRIRDEVPQAGGLLHHIFPRQVVAALLQHLDHGLGRCIAVHQISVGDIRAR